MTKLTRIELRLNRLHDGETTGYRPAMKFSASFPILRKETALDVHWPFIVTRNNYRSWIYFGEKLTSIRVTAETFIRRQLFPDPGKGREELRLQLASRRLTELEVSLSSRSEAFLSNRATRCSTKQHSSL